jgi:hypothetical protein
MRTETALIGEQDKFIALLEDIGSEMRGNSPGSILDASRYVGEDKVVVAQHLATRLAGRWFSGITSADQYFIQDVEFLFEPEKTSTRGLNVTHEFAGNLEAVEDIPTVLPNYSRHSAADTKHGLVLCLKLRQLSSIAGLDRSIPSRHPEWLRYVNQPLGEAKHARKPLWLPISYFQPGSLAFVDWEQSSGPPQGENLS